MVTMLGRGRKPYKSLGNLRSFRLSIPVIVILLISIPMIAIYSTRGNIPAINQLNNPESSLASSQLLNPTVEIVNGTELIWQIPDSPRAIVFLAHGCGGKAGNFWDKSNRCPDCLGLPEERLIVMNALIREFAVLAVSSVRKCWSFGKEIALIRDSIQRWIEKNGLSSVPLFAIGASSGGYFVSQLANDDNLRFSSIVIMIAEGLFDQMDLKSDYPPTLFLHMPKDQRRNRIIPINVELLRKQGIDAKEVKSMEFPLNPSFFANRVPGINATVSKGLYELFLEKGFIDSNGYMKKDGRQTPWIKALKESMISLPYETVSTHHVQEELNLAFAYHEMTSLESKEMFECD
ncbi:hypothetical protein V2J09_009965 [Rumex salicifolius]